MSREAYQAVEREFELPQGTLDAAFDYGGKFFKKFQYSTDNTLEKISELHITLYIPCKVAHDRSRLPPQGPAKDAYCQLPLSTLTQHLHWYDNGTDSRCVFAQRSANHQIFSLRSPYCLYYPASAPRLPSIQYPRARQEDHTILSDHFSPAVFYIPMGKSHAPSNHPHGKSHDTLSAFCS